MSAMPFGIDIANTITLYSVYMFTPKSTLLIMGALAFHIAQLTRS